MSIIVLFVFILLVFADIPEKPWVSIIRSQSAVVSWKAPRDHLKSRITEYVVLLLNESGSIIRNITISPENENISSIHTVSLSNLSEFTTYSVKIAAVNAISKSNFSENVTFFTLRKYYVLSFHTYICFKICNTLDA